MALYKSTCEVCYEPIEFTLEKGWYHPQNPDRLPATCAASPGDKCPEHPDKDCGTGDGSTAYPSNAAVLPGELADDDLDRLGAAGYDVSHLRVES